MKIDLYVWVGANTAHTRHYHAGDIAVSKNSDVRLLSIITISGGDVVFHDAVSFATDDDKRLGCQGA